MPGWLDDWMVKKGARHMSERGDFHHWVVPGMGDLLVAVSLGEKKGDEPGPTLGVQIFLPIPGDMDAQFIALEKHYNGLHKPKKEKLK